MREEYETEVTLYTSMKEIEKEYQVFFNKMYVL